MNSRSTKSLAILAVMCLGAGAMVYVAGRPQGTAYLLPTAWQAQLDWPWLASAWGWSLPSFLHAVAFCLLTGLVLRPWRFAAGAACSFWLVVSCALEIAQADSIAPTVTARLPAFFDRWPVLDHLGAYLQNGRMDPLDLAFTLLGCGLAYALLQNRKVTRRALAATTRVSVTALIVAAGLVALVGSTVIATSGDINRPKPPEPEEPPPPEVDAGPDQAVKAGDVVQLQASTVDGDGRIAAVNWTQRAGPAVTLSEAATSNPTLIAPPVTATTELQFELQARDGRRQADSGGTDVVSVFVSPTAPVTLDFETLPDGSLPAAFAAVADDYATECLHFASAAGDTTRGPEYRRLATGNTVVWDNERRFNPPPETPFHITVNFDTPVTRVGADVFAEPGASVLMTAIGADGAVLGTAKSAVSSTCCTTKTGTLMLGQLGEIYRVRFQTSTPQDTRPIIDNLRFERDLACLP
ncbi:MAG: hypothetical protein JSV45_09950 [Chromatiales bacterium]|nr:MAG: hypothetical protein JSV45_09950 [Chromatiales bacterium]